MNSNNTDIDNKSNMDIDEITSDNNRPSNNNLNDKQDTNIVNNKPINNSKSENKNMSKDLNQKIDAVKNLGNSAKNIAAGYAKGGLVGAGASAIKEAKNIKDNGKKIVPDNFRNKNVAKINSIANSDDENSKLTDSQELPNQNELPNNDNLSSNDLKSSFNNSLSNIGNSIKNNLRPSNLFSNDKQEEKEDETVGADGGNGRFSDALKNPASRKIIIVVLPIIGGVFVFLLLFIVILAPVIQLYNDLTDRGEDADSIISNGNYDYLYNDESYYNSEIEKLVTADDSVSSKVYGSAYLLVANKVGFESGKEPTDSSPSKIKTIGYSGYLRYILWSVSGNDPGSVGCDKFSDTSMFTEVDSSDLKMGDFGVIDSCSTDTDFFGIYNGTDKWVHITSDQGAVEGSTSIYTKYYRLNESYASAKINFSDEFNSVNTSTAQDLGIVASNYSIPNNGGNNPVVYFSQSGNQPWSSVKFGGGTISTSGCSVTSLAMVISYLKGGTDNSKWVYPSDVVSMIENKTGSRNTFYVSSSGQSWGIMSAVAGYYGLKCSQISSSSIISALNAGHPVIMSCHSGEFTRNGHFIVLTGVTDDGYVVLNDPNSNHANKSGKKYTVSYLTTQANAYWEFSS